MKKILVFMLFIILFSIMINLQTSAGTLPIDGLLNSTDITKISKDDVFKELKSNDIGESIFSIKNPMNIESIKKEDIKVNFIEECGYVKTDELGNKKYTLTINSTCEAERIKEKIYVTNEVCKDIVNNLNRYQFSLSDDLIYQYYFHAIPKGKRYIKWTKKDKVDKKKESILLELSKKHNCSILEIKKGLI